MIRAVTLPRLLGCALLAAICGAACDNSDDPTFPVSVAPASTADALRDGLTSDAAGLSFSNGDWLEDRGDAPFFGTAWLARRNADAPLTGDDATRLAQSLDRARALLAADVSDATSGSAYEKLEAAFGLIENVAASKDASDVAAIDSFLDRLDVVLSAMGDYLDNADPTSWAILTFGPTSMTGLVALVHAQYALLIDSARTNDHLNRAIALEQHLTDVALDDLESASGQATRGYQIVTGDPTLDLYPNVVMMLVEGRLYRLTHDEAYLLQARALYGAIQPLKISDTPARYQSPYAQAELNTTTNDLATLSSQNYLAWGLMVMFEITGDHSFIDESDRVLDAIEQMRGPWCLAQVDGVACTPMCTTGQACVATSCTADRCTTGLLYDYEDGNPADTMSPILFCSGCNLQTLYVIGYRRSLANETF